jgi:hypothetical protein
MGCGRGLQVGFCSFACVIVRIENSLKNGVTDKQRRACSMSDEACAQTIRPRRLVTVDSLPAKAAPWMKINRVWANAGLACCSLVQSLMHQVYFSLKVVIAFPHAAQGFCQAIADGFIHVMPVFARVLVYARSMSDVRERAPNSDCAMYPTHTSAHIETCVTNRYDVIAAPPPPIPKFKTWKRR